MTKPPRNYTVYLNDERARKLAQYREGRDDTLGDILMAGIGALENSHYGRLMNATCRHSHDDSFLIEVFGKSWFVRKGERFRTSPRAAQLDSYLVRIGDDECYFYGGTRHNCELVAAHLNSILREAEEASNE